MLYYIVHGGVAEPGIRSGLKIRTLFGMRVQIPPPPPNLKIQIIQRQESR